MHWPNVGILMKNENPKSKFASSNNPSSSITNYAPLKFIDLELVPHKARTPLLHAKTELAFDEKKLHFLMEDKKNASSVKVSDKSKLMPPKSLNINRKLSRSANEIEEEKRRKEVGNIGIIPLTKNNRSNSDKDLNLNMVSSQSENALKSLMNFANVITSPTPSTRDMLSPFSKFAKGVHTLGANLDPRKLKNIHPTEPFYKMSENHLEEIKKLKERWKNCESKLIAL